MAQEPLGRRDRCGTTTEWPDENLRNRDGRQRSRVSAGCHKRVEQLDCKTGRLLAAGEVASTTEVSTRIDCPGAIASTNGSRPPHRFQVAVRHDVFVRLAIDAPEGAGVARADPMEVDRVRVIGRDFHEEAVADAQVGCLDHRIRQRQLLFRRSRASALMDRGMSDRMMAGRRYVNQSYH